MFNMHTGLLPLVSLVSSLDPLQGPFFVAASMHFSMRQDSANLN